MQRYPATSCGGGVSNIAVGGTSSRDSARADSSFPSSNFSVNQRRLVQLIPYKLSCDKEPLNGRLGPPDYYPQTTNCPEETLTKEYVQLGYRETVDGLEEAKEISITQIGAFSKPVIIKCKEAIRKRFRAINESRAQKRKAGQVYGVPLSGSLLSRPCVFPEQRPCSEDFRKKWIEGLSQPHKRLRVLAEHVPHGYRRKALFEALVRHNVPLLRATWFIKVTYLNQVRPVSSSISSGAPDKTQLARSELWARDVFEYLQYLLDEFSKAGSFSTPQGRDQSHQMLLAASSQFKGDSSPASCDGDEPSLHFKWWYMVRILLWHHAEGLLIPSHIIDWVLNQIQEKDPFETLQLLLPVVFGLIETIAMSQTCVRNLLDVALHCIQEPSPGGSSLLDNSRRAYMISALVEMLHYFIVSVPDTFVAFDCLPLPSIVLSDALNARSFLLKAPEDVERIQNGPRVFSTANIDKELDVHHKSFDYFVSSIQKRADNLVKAVSPGGHGHGVAKAVQALDKSLISGDMGEAYKFLFEDLCDGGIKQSWIADVSPCLRASLKWLATVSLSLICSVFFLCEWATCDFRDFRTVIPPGVKLTGRKDFSQVYTAVLLLKMQMEESNSLVQCKDGGPSLTNSLAKGVIQRDGLSVGTTVDSATVNRSKSTTLGGNVDRTDLFQSPGPMHDIVVCWIDQHEVGKGEGFKRLQLLIMELIRSGIFYPQTYVRQLIVSGIMDMNETPLDLERRQRHHRMLKQLPGTYLFDILKEANIADDPLLLEVIHVYSNERRLVLHGLTNCNSRKKSGTKLVPQTLSTNFSSGREGASSASLDNPRHPNSVSGPLSVRNNEVKPQVAELKTVISMLLHLPYTHSSSTDAQPEEPHGIKRSIGLYGSTGDAMDGTDGCEECRRVKRLKSSDERSSYPQGFASIPSDDEDTWWVRKGPKPLESFKVDPPLKSIKNVSRGRRKTQSLAQLAAARIEGSQGASTSHVCDNKGSCPHHRSGIEGEIPKVTDEIRATHLGDVIKIGKALKQLRLLERRTISVWLLTLVKQLVEGTEKTASKGGQTLGSFPPMDDRNPQQWKLDEDKLSSILYLIDISSDLISAIKFLLWLLAKIPSGPNPTYHGARSILMLPKNAETHACNVGEAFLLSCIRRYENILLAADLLPEALSATMRRASAVMVSNGRASGSSAFIYARNLLKKYGDVASVDKWEKNLKPTYDQRLLAELESGRSLDGEFGFSPGVPAGVEDLDGYFRQKIGRLSRAGPSMKELVQRRIEEAVHYFYNKERKLMAAGTPKSPGLEKWDEGYQIAQQIVVALMDCIRQNGGAAQEGDHSLVASAIAAIVGNVGLAVAKMPDFMTSNNYPKFQSPVSLLNCARRVVHIHTTCLCLLKEALGERQCRVFEVALAAEASSAVSGAVAPGKASRSQFPEVHDSNTNPSNENLNSSSKAIFARATKAAAAVSALVIGAVVHGVINLDRLVTLFRLKDGLDIFQFIRNVRSSSNGISRSIGALKVDNSIEVYVHWFRLLIGNCRTVSDGLVVELLGEPYILALSRMQRMLPISLVLPPAYSIFAMVIWKPYILNVNIASREDVQVYQSLTMAIDDVVRHQPFRDVCLRDTQAFYENLASDVGDSEFAAMLELHGPDKHLRTMAFVPLRARLFLNVVLDCKVPSMVAHGDGSWVQGHGESKIHNPENEVKLIDKLVHVLDTLQPAKLHWQWVELRLLLNEHVLVEKVDGPFNVSLVDAIRSLLPTGENVNLSDNEKNFADIVLTRLLVRPNAAPLYSEVVHLLGRAWDEYLLTHSRWFLAGHDVLYGRKSIRQRLVGIAQPRNLSTKLQFWKPWGWSNSPVDAAANRVDKKLEATSLEEGEVVEEGLDFKKAGKMTPHIDTEGIVSSQQYVTEKALVDLILQCLDHVCSESRNAFANELIKQLNLIEQQINLLSGGASKQAGTIPLGVDGAANKGNSRKAMRGGSPGLGRRLAAAVDPAPPSSVALRASLWVRLQFILRLLPIIYADREPPGRNMRHMLASVILRLLGSRVVYMDAEIPYIPKQSCYKRDAADSLTEPAVGAPLDFSGHSLFDQYLSVLYGLLSGWKPSWLKLKSASKSTVRSSRDFSGFDREVAESLQIDLDRMQLPDSIRWRIQAAMPVLARVPPRTISCQPPAVSTAALASLQSSLSAAGFQQGNSNQPQRNTIRAHGKSRPSPQLDQDMEIDPWTLLEDGTGCAPASSNSNASVAGDQNNLKACYWLKGAVRVRRTELTYIRAVDDDS